MLNKAHLEVEVGGKHESLILRRKQKVCYMFAGGRVHVFVSDVLWYQCL